MEIYHTTHPSACRSWLAEAIGLSRKCCAHTVETSPVDTRDETLVTAIVSILHTYPYYGYRRVTAELKRQHIPVNKKRVQRIMHDHELAQKRRKRFVKTTNSNHRLMVYPNLVASLVPSYPHHIWAADITYVRLEKGFCYVALIVDTFAKRIVGWAIDTHMEVSLVLAALRMGLAHTAPAYHHSDRGGQYCAKEYVALLAQHNVQISMADPGMSVDNPYAESLNRTIKVEEVYLREYRTIDDARESLKHFIEVVYNTKRLHSSIGYVPPAEFEARWHMERTHPLQLSEAVVPLSA